MSTTVSKTDISEAMLDKKVLFIGLDGASKRIIDKMMAQKELPAIERLISTGSYFHSSHSFKPCASPVIWTSMSTGKKPEKHGIKGFFDNTYSLTAKRIWEIFDILGFPVGVMGHFLTWPPQKVNDGFIIPNILALGNECYPENYGFLWELTHDPDNQKKISARRMLKYFGPCYKNGIRLSTFLEVVLGFVKKRLPFLENLDRFSFISSISMRTKLYRDLFIHLYRKFKPQYAYFHIHLIDTYSHYYWQYLEPELYDNVPQDEVRRYGQKIYNAYRNADHIIQNILDAVDSDTLVVIASDHGFRGVEKASSWFDQMTVRVQKLVSMDPKGDIYVSIIIPTIHVRVRNATPEKNNYYKAFLQSIKILENKKSLFTIEEIEAGDFLLEFNREIDGISGKHIEVNGKSFPAEDLLMKVQDYTAGVHDEKDGILILNGPGIQQNGSQKNAVHTYDITPTILALCNMPIGEDMDGEVITAGIENDFLQKYPIHYIGSYEDVGESEADAGKREFSEEEARNLKEQLKDLGYM
jgi:predicted AlkP superfamily pyrophosphatase or phosphodiesterase